MRSALADNLFTVSSLLTAEECRALIMRGEEIGFQEASVKMAGGPTLRPEIRNNDRVEFVDAELAETLWNRCQPHVPHQLNDGHAIGLDENFRFYRYDVGQRFKRHRDGVVARSPVERSQLTCLLYLNHGFIGGETVFYAPQSIEGKRFEEAIVTPVTGDALFFRHDWWHEGRPLREGRNYVLRSDVFYLFSNSATTK